MKVMLDSDLFVYDIKALIRTFCLGEKLEVVISEAFLGEVKTFSDIEQNQQKSVQADHENGAVDHPLCVFLSMSEDIFVSIWDMEGNKQASAKGKGTPGERRDYKNQVKRVLFSALEELTGKKPAWGTLTGVRPTKLPMEYFAKGIKREEIHKMLKETYLCSDGKLKLAIGIAEREEKLLQKIDWQNGYSLYVGIPFCPTTCHYCSFTSFSLEKFGSLVPEYLKALHREIDLTARMMTGKKLTCVYFGGGTPTTLTADQMNELICHVKAVFPFQDVVEFTVEAGRPDTVTKEKLEVLKENGVDRISINPQTMQQKTLDRVGRNHTVKQIEDSMKLAREVGFHNINMDLIVGLPGEEVSDVKETLEAVTALSPDSITVHSMVLKRAAKLNLMMSVMETTDSDSMDKMVQLGMDYAGKMGLSPYYMYRQKNAQGSQNQSRDNIGYAKEGKEGLYNIIIMEEKQSILALGAGATTKFVEPETGRIERADNVKSVKDYIERVGEMVERKRAILKWTGPVERK